MLNTGVATGGGVADFPDGIPSPIQTPKHHRTSSSLVLSLNNSESFALERSFQSDETSLNNSSLLLGYSDDGDAYQVERNNNSVEEGKSNPIMMINRKDNDQQQPTIVYSSSPSIPALALSKLHNSPARSRSNNSSFSSVVVVGDVITSVSNNEEESNNIPSPSSATLQTITSQTQQQPSPPYTNSNSSRISDVNNHHQFTPNSNRSNNSTLSNISSASSSMIHQLHQQNHRTPSPTNNHANSSQNLHSNNTTHYYNHYSLNSNRSNTSAGSRHGGALLSPHTPRRGAGFGYPGAYHHPLYRTTSTPTISPRYSNYISPRINSARSNRGGVYSGDHQSLSDIVNTSLEEEGTFPSFGTLLDTICERQFDRVFKCVGTVIDDSEREIEQLRIWNEKNIEEINYLNQLRENLMNQYQELTREVDRDRHSMLLKSKENENVKFELEMKSLEAKNFERQLSSSKIHHSELTDKIEQLEREIKQKEKQISKLESDVAQSEESIRSKVSDLSNLNKKIEVYNVEMNEMKMNREKLETQMEALKREIKTLKSNNEGYLTLIDEQNKKINRANTTLKEKQTELDNKENERQLLHNQMIMLKRNNSDKDLSLSDAENDLQKLKKKYDDQSKEFESYKIEMKLEIEKYHNLVSDQQLSKMSEVEREQFTKKHSDLLHQFEALQLKHSSSISDLHETKIECQEHQRTNESQKKEIDRLSRKINEYETEKVQLDERIKQLENSVFDQKTNISKLYKENEDLESNIYELKKDVKSKDQSISDLRNSMDEKDKEIQKAIDNAKEKDVQIANNNEKTCELQKRMEQYEHQIKQLNIDKSELSEECDNLRRYVTEEKSFILESDPTLKMVLLMKEEGFPMDETYIDKIRGKSIFNLLRMGVGAYNIRGEDSLSESERRKEENFFAERAMSKWLQSLLPEDYNPDQNLYENIADGYILCKMIDALFKEVQPCDHIKYDPALLRNQRTDSDNLSVYLEHCKKLELKSFFQPDVLFKVKEAFVGIPSLSQDSTLTKERALIVSNIAQVFELGIKCNYSPTKKEEILNKLYNAKQERDANSPLISRSRSASVNSARNSARTKRNSIALSGLTVPIPSTARDGLTPKSARFTRETFEGKLDFSPSISGNKSPSSLVPYLKNFTNPTDSLSQASSPHSTITTEDDIWLEHMLEDMKITPPATESKFSLKYYLNRAGTYFISEEQREEFMVLLQKFKFLQVDLTGCQKFITDKEIGEIILRLCENKEALRVDLSGYNLKTHFSLLEKYISSKTAVKYLLIKECGFSEEEKGYLKRQAKAQDIFMDQ